MRYFSCTLLQRLPYRLRFTQTLLKYLYPDHSLRDNKPKESGTKHDSGRLIGENEPESSAHGTFGVIWYL